MFLKRRCEMPTANAPGCNSSALNVTQTLAKDPMLLSGFSCSEAQGPELPSRGTQQLLRRALPTDSHRGDPGGSFPAWGVNPGIRYRHVLSLHDHFLSHILALFLGKQHQESSSWQLRAGTPAGPGSPAQVPGRNVPENVRYVRGGASK